MDDITGLLQQGDPRSFDRAVELLALDRLAEETLRAARVVGCCYFAGMTAEETATATGGSVATVERDWSKAHRRLRTLLQSETRQGVS